MSESFDQRIDHDPEEDVPRLPPVHTVDFDPDFAGQWLIAGDLDGDGVAELLTARNQGQAITAMSAWRLDGQCLWTWGAAAAGTPVRTYDLPLQIHDVDGDGRLEVIFSVPGQLVIAEGATGRVLERRPLPDGLEVADCITFARLSSPERADTIIKTRYTRLWAFDPDWRELWSWEPADGHKTCHHPTAVDVDGDGRDEVMAGYSLLDAEGREGWIYGSETVDLHDGHLDCCRVVATGDRPGDVRLAVTACGADHMALLDGAGHVLWELAGHHFESVESGRLRREADWDLVVDIDHRPFGESPTWVLDAAGCRLGNYQTNYSRFHCLVDIDGDGLDEILLSHARTLCDGAGNVRYRLDADRALDATAGHGADGDPGPFAVVGDMTGDGRVDIVAHTESRAVVYANQGPPVRNDLPVGTAPNFTLY